MISILYNDTPVYLDAVMTESFDPKNPFPGISYSWNKIPKGEKQDFPEKLFLISRENWVEFDYHAQFNGFILSDRFLSFMQKYGNMENFQIVKLSIIGTTGNILTETGYNYLYPYKRANIIDYDASQYITKTGRERNESLPVNGTWISKYITLELKKNTFEEEIIVANDVLFGQYFFVKEDVLTLMRDNAFKGFNAIAYTDFPSFYNKVNFL